MFSDPSRALYQSGGFLSLYKLYRVEYCEYIQHLFVMNKQDPEDGVLDYIPDWTQVSFYTQNLCNKVFSKDQRRITTDLVRECILEIFSEREGIFYNYRNLLSQAQFRLLAALDRTRSSMNRTAGILNRGTG